MNKRLNISPGETFKSVRPGLEISVIDVENVSERMRTAIGKVMLADGEWSGRFTTGTQIGLFEKLDTEITMETHWTLGNPNSLVFLENTDGGSTIFDYATPT